MKVKKVILISCLLSFVLVFFSVSAWAQKTVVIAGPGGSWQKMVEEHVLKTFEKKMNCKIKYIPGITSDNLAKVIASRNNPEIDVLYGGDGQQIKGGHMGLFEKLDVTKVPNLAYLYPKLKSDFNAFNGVNAMGIVYNTKIFQEKGFPTPTSIHDLLRPEYKGRVMVDSVTSLYGMGLLILLSKANGGSESNMDPGFEMMTKLKDSIVFFGRTVSDSSRILQQGTAWICFWGKTRQAVLADTGFPVGFATLKEGIPPNVMGASVVKNSKVLDLSYGLVNHLLSVEAQVSMAKTLYLGPTVQNVKLSPEDAGKVFYGSEQISRLMDIDWVTVMDRQSDWIERWNKEIQFN